MKRYLFVFIIVFFYTNFFAQKWNREIICSTDTLMVEPHVSIKYNPNSLDSLAKAPYRIVRCMTRSNVGFRFEFGVSKYYCGEEMKSWIGQHAGPNFNFILSIDKLNVGLRFKPWTVDPKKEMEFNGHALPLTARINPIKIDYYVGYSLDFNRLISLEPYVGYNRSSFNVINEDELNQKFHFNKTGGLILGATLNKYFKVKDYEYIALFGSAGYGFVNYAKVHPDLDNGYFEWNLGIAYKGFLTKIFNKRV